MSRCKVERKDNTEDEAQGSSHTATISTSEAPLRTGCPKVVLVVLAYGLSFVLFVVLCFVLFSLSRRARASQHGSHGN